MVLLKFIAREVKSRPGRATLTLLSIVIAVAALVSVNVATETTSQAYREMYEKVTGRAALEVVSETGGAFDESVVSAISQVPGVKAAVPYFQQFTTLRYGEGDQAARVRMLLMGIDPAKDEAVRDYRLREGEFFRDGEGALMEIGFARGLGVEIGKEIRIFTSRLIQRVPVVGLLAPEGAAQFNEGGIVFMPLETVQYFFKAEGQVTAISIVLHDGADEKTAQAEVARILPAGLTVRSPMFRTQLARETLQDAEQGLSFTYQLTLVLAVFMILNTFLMNVGERRRHLAVLRAIGTTRGQLMRTMLAEGLLMGVLGTLIGSVIGIGGAYVLSDIMARAMSVTMPAIRLTPGAFALAAVLGPGLSVLAMYIPARIASRITPLEGMRPVVVQERARVPLAYTIGGATAFVVTGCLLGASVLGFLPIKMAIFSGVVFTASFVLLIPAVLGPMTRLASFVLHPILGVEGELARRQVLRRRARTTLTIGVLYIAVSSGIGLGTTIINNVADVRKWHAQTFVGDFFLRAMFSDQTTGNIAHMPESLLDEIQAIPGVTGVDTVWISAEGKAEEQDVWFLVRGLTGSGPMPLDIKEGGQPEEVRQRLMAGEVVAGSVFMQRTGKRVGDEVTIQTTTGPKNFRIAAMTTEYLAGGMVIQMARETGKRALAVQGVDVFMITASPEARHQVEAQLKAISDRHGLLLHSLAELRHRLDGIVNGVIASLWGLLALGFVVAAFGIANTLTMNVLEQTRELALLRVVAMTRFQVRKTILSQATVIGAIGLTAGMIGGLVGAYITNLSSWAILGHSVDFALHPELLAICFGAGLAIVVVAALLPAERAARLNLLIALQYE